MMRRPWNYKPIQRVAAQRSFGKSSYWRQPGSNQSNLRVIQAEKFFTENEETNSNSNKIASDSTNQNSVGINDIPKREKDFDEISDSPLTDEDNVLVKEEEHWENISESSFEVCEVRSVESSSNSTIPRGNDFAVGYRSCGIKYLKGCKHVGFFKPKVYVVSKTRCIVNCVNIAEKVLEDGNVVDETEEEHINCSGLVTVDTNEVDEGKEEEAEKRSENKANEEKLCSVGTVLAPPSEENGFCQRKLKIQDDIGNQDKLIIGLEYIVEVWSCSSRSVINYLCWLCNRKSLEKKKNVLDHLVSSEHRMAYLEKHFPSQSSKISQTGSASCGPESVESFFKEVVKGRDKLLSFVTTQEYLDKHEVNSLNALVEAAPHYEEKQGESTNNSNKENQIIVNVESSEKHGQNSGAGHCADEAADPDISIIAEYKADGKAKGSDTESQGKQLSFNQRFFMKNKIYNSAAKYRLSLRKKANKTLHHLCRKRTLTELNNVPAGEQLLPSEDKAEEEFSITDETQEVSVIQTVPGKSAGQEKLVDSISSPNKQPTHLNKHSSHRHHSSHSSSRNKSKDIDNVNLSSKNAVNKQDKKAKQDADSEERSDKEKKKNVTENASKRTESKKNEDVSHSGRKNKVSSKERNEQTELDSAEKCSETSKGKSRKGKTKNEVESNKGKHVTSRSHSNSRTSETHSQLKKDEADKRHYGKNYDGRLEERHRDDRYSGMSPKHKREIRQLSPAPQRLSDRESRGDLSPVRQIRRRSRSPQFNTRLPQFNTRFHPQPLPMGHLRLPQFVPRNQSQQMPRNRLRSPQYLPRNRSRSPGNLPRNRSRSPLRANRNRSRSPLRANRNRSRSPLRSIRNRSRSPLHLNRNRSRSPLHLNRNRSRSPQNASKNRSRSPLQYKNASDFSKNRRSRSDSRSRKFGSNKVKRHSRSLSRSPRRHQRSNSRSDRRRSRSGSRSPSRTARSEMSRSRRKLSNSGSRSPSSSRRDSRYNRHKKNYSSDSEHSRSSSKHRSNKHRRSDSHSRIPDESDVWAVVRSMNELTNNPHKMKPPLSGGGNMSLANEREKIAAMHRNMAGMGNLGIPAGFMPPNMPPGMALYPPIPNMGVNPNNYMNPDGSMRPLMNPEMPQFVPPYGNVLPPQPQHTAQFLMPQMQNNQLMHNEFVKASMPGSNINPYANMPQRLPVPHGFGNEKVFRDMRNVVNKLFGTQAPGGNMFPNPLGGHPPSSVPEMGNVGFKSQGLGNNAADMASLSNAGKPSGMYNPDVQKSPMKMTPTSVSSRGLSSDSAAHIFGHSRENTELNIPRVALPPGAKVQFKESSKLPKSTNIFPIVKQNTASNQQLPGKLSQNDNNSNFRASSGPSENTTKLSLAQRLASVLVKLGMVDVPGYLLSEMLRTIGAFDPTMPLQDITETQILAILHKCGYLKNKK